jgi:hypothetical protein
MRDLSMEELGHVYGAGGKGHPRKCKKHKGNKSRSKSRSKSHSKSKTKTKKPY